MAHFFLIRNTARVRKFKSGYAVPEIVKGLLNMLL
jgi:hypothetical protein